MAQLFFVPINQSFIIAFLYYFCCDLSMQNLTRDQLIADVAARLGVARCDVSLVVRESLAVLSESVASGRRVMLRDFGVFELRPHGGGLAPADLRAGNTHEFIEIPPHMRVVFKPCPSLRLKALAVPVPPGKLRVR